MKNLFGEKTLINSGSYDKAIETLGIFHKYYENGLIEPYEFNRGLIGIDPDRVNDIAENFNPQALGEVTVCQLPGTDKYMLLDFHHRAAAIKVVATDDEVWNQVRESSMTVCIVPYADRMEVYKRLNRQKGHTGIQTASNPNLAVGDVVLKALNEAGYSIGDIKDNRLQAIGDLIGGARTSFKENRAVNYSDMTRGRGNFTTAYGDSAAGTLEIPYEVWAPLVEGLKVYKDLTEGMRSEAKIVQSSVDKKNLDSLSDATGFLQGVGLLYLAGASLKNTDKALNEIKKNSGELIEVCGTLARRNKKKVNFTKFCVLLGFPKPVANKLGLTVSPFFEEEKKN